tara:strand:+ start:47749 stop:48648 length:900 start_codon:yes stop_codon:yes gene_type:complete
METIDLELIRIFVKVIQQGSFSKASIILGIPKSTVSKSVTKLEETLGTKLLLRTTRSQSLTSSGRLFYETCLEPIQVLEDAQRSMTGQDSIVSGNIKITAPEDIGYQIVSPIVGELTQKYPELTFEMHFTNSIVDLIADGFDLAVRIGPLRESNLKARKIGNLDMSLVAADSYLKKHPPILKPKDLENHDVLMLPPVSSKNYWSLVKGKTQVKVPVKTRLVSNQITSLLYSAAAGGGITLAPAFLCRNLLEEKGLIRVLPEWKIKGIPISLVSPIATSSSARLKIVSDALFDTISSRLN